MAKISKHEEVKILYLSGKKEREIAAELRISIHKIRQMVSEVVSEFNEIKVNREDQIKNMEKYLFMRIEAEQKEE